LSDDHLNPAAPATLPAASDPVDPSAAAGLAAPAPSSASSDRDAALVEFAHRQARRRPASAPTPAPSGSVRPVGQLPPADSFPGYQIIREIHRGGQGVVYLALHKTTKRKVAIKVMHEGPFAGHRDRIRFEREVQILAQLSHPGIVTVHDSGSSSGSFFYVMDYISGQTLDVFMAGHGGAGGERPLEDTLRLFAKICEAVNAAHLKGVIHRDLKPANIRIDAQGEPHVVDFGLAKVAVPETASAGPGGGVPELMTMTGQFVGSIPWASPEQAQGSPDNIDTRTDVYSLGVVLYQMLTGKFPYQVVGPMRDVLDNILHAEPAKPSAAHKHPKGMDSDVDTIVLKCLAKDRERRYQSAGELARDIRHFLAGEPIEAKSDSAFYVLSKTLSRHRVSAGFVALIAVMILLFGPAMAVLWKREQAATVRETAAKELAASEATRATDEAANARREASKAEKIQNATEQILIAANPSRAKGQDVTVKQALDQYAPSIDQKFAGEPEIAAGLHRTVGKTYRVLGQFDAAAEHLADAFELRRSIYGETATETLSSKNDLALSFRDAGKFDQAVRLLRDVVAGFTKNPPKDESLLPVATTNLARCLERSGGDSKEIESLYRDALRLSTASKEGGADEQRTLGIMANLGAFLTQQNRPEEAEPVLRRAYETSRKSAALGPDHPTTLKATIELASVLQALKRYPEAEPLFRAAADGYTKAKGPSSPDTLATMGRHAAALMSSEPPRYQEAADELKTVVARALASPDLGPGHWHTAIHEQHYGNCLRRLQRYDDAQTQLLASYRALRGARGPGSAETKSVIADLVGLYRDWQKPDQQRPWEALQQDPSSPAPEAP
jgi:serine/threonine protein kinase